MRAFVALEIPDPKVLDSIVNFQEELAKTGADLRLVGRENLHFTVKFLGEVSDSQAQEADRLLRALSLPSAAVELKGVGTFPSPSRPNVVWVGLTPEGEEAMSRIAGPVIETLREIGERDRRPFQSHLTIGRVRSARNSGALAVALEGNALRSFGSVRLNTLKLKSSVLTPSGPVYTDVGEYPLT